jgi:ADP-ribose pyrophosphatase YjhB (NUDIX family)
MAYVEPEVWYQQLPTFYAAAGALIRDEHGRILLVKPNYRPEWSLPGGVVEALETPHAACEREIREELDLTVTAAPLLVVDWVPPSDERPRPFIYFLFDCGTLDGQPITLQTSELDDYGFYDPATAAHHTAPHVARRIPAAIHAANTGGTVYLPHHPQTEQTDQTDHSTRAR